MLAMIVKYFSTRSARTGVGHLPEVVRGIRRAFVVADADDALSRQANFVVPDIEGFVVGVVYRDQQFVFRQLPNAGQQFPGETEWRLA